MAGSRGDIMAGRAYVELTVRNSAFYRGLRDAKARLQQFGADMTGLGLRVLAAGSVMSAPFVAAIRNASDFQEVMSKFRVVFGERSDEVKQWGDGFASQVQRSQGDIAKFLAANQDLFVPLGFEPGAAEDLSKQVATLTIDLASFNNMADADVHRDLQAALTGSGEVMKKYGVIVSEAAVKQELLQQGIDPTTASNQEKVQARLNIIMAGTTAAQGDAIRTAGGFANQMKGLYGRIKDLSVEIGSALLPTVTAIVSKMNSAATVAIKWAKENTGLVVTVAAISAGVVAAGLAISALGISASFAATVIGGLMAIINLAAYSFGVMLLPLALVRMGLSALTAVAGVARAAFLSMTVAVAVVRAAVVSWMAVVTLARVRLVVLTLATIAHQAVLSVLTAALWTFRAGLLLSSAATVIQTVATNALSAAMSAAKTLIMAFIVATRTMTASMIIYRAVTIAARSATTGMIAVLGVLRGAWAAVSGGAIVATIATQAFAAVGLFLSALTSPMLLVGVAVAGIGYAAYQAVGGFRGLGEMARSVMGSISGVASDVFGRLSALFGNLKTTAIAVFGGIRDALATGDLALAGQIAMTGLRLVFMQGMEAIAEMLNGTWADTVGTLASQISGGDFAGAWNTAVLAMDAIWTKFSAGLVKTFIGAGREVLRVWRATVDAISNYILQQAAKGGLVGAAIEMSTGVNVKEEVAKDKANKAEQSKTRGRLEVALGEAQQGLASATSPEEVAKFTSDVNALTLSLSQLDANGVPDVFKMFEQGPAGAGGGGADFLDAAAQRVRDALTAIGTQLSLTPDEIEAQIAGALDQLESGVLPTFEAAATAAGGALADGVAGGAAGASEEITKLQGELAALQAEAKKKRDAANQLPADQAGAVAADDGKAGAKAGEAKPTGGSTAVATSAAGLLALGSQGGETGIWTSKDTAQIKRVMIEVEREAAKARAKEAQMLANAISGLGLHHA